MQRFKASYYNRVLDVEAGALLFNGATGALVRLGREAAARLSPFLGPPRSNAAGAGLADWRPRHFSPDELPPESRDDFPELLRGSFFVPADRDEQLALEGRLQDAKRDGPLYVRVTTTLDCNFNCYYCFEDKGPARLTQPACDAIRDWVVGRLDTSPHRALYTDWFGGEPMLNREAIEYLSESLIGETDARGWHYESAITSNGSLWPEDPRSFVLHNRIRKVQLTLDGPGDHHRRRRKPRTGAGGGIDTFQAVVHLVGQLMADADVILRVNVDPGIGETVLDLVPFFQDQGWLAPGTRVFPHLALIGPMNSHCGHLDSEPFRQFRGRFAEINREFQRRLARPAAHGVEARLPAFPNPLRAPCSAVEENSVIFGPDGRMYKCVLDVGQEAMAHGRVVAAGGGGPPAPDPLSLPVLLGPGGPHPYAEYDPFRHPRCSQCQYLPVCLGGCPKDQFEGNAFFLEERSAFWENNLDFLILLHYEQSCGGVPAAGSA